MKKVTTTMKKSRTSGSIVAIGGGTRSKQVDARSNKTNDWRSEILAQVRNLIQAAVPEAVEQIKWRKPSNPAGVPVWSHGGIICTGETYKDKVKLTFAKGAALKDPARLFNSSLDGNARRAIDFHEGDEIDEKALKAIILAAVALNTSPKAAAGAARSQKRPKKA
jgi:hypothetical protein